jgi:hypothetical protein
MVFHLPQYPYQEFEEISQVFQSQKLSSLILSFSPSSIGVVGAVKSTSSHIVLVFNFLDSFVFIIFFVGGNKYCFFEGVSWSIDLLTGITKNRHQLLANLLFYYQDVLQNFLEYTLDQHL